MENEELELAALEAELAALEASEAEPLVVEAPKPPKPRKKRAPKPAPEPKVEVVVEPVRISKAKTVRPMRSQGTDRQRGIRYRD